MNSQVNKQSDQKDQVLQEDQFRTVCFDSSKRSSTSNPSDQAKRVRLDTSADPSAPAKKYSNASVSLMLNNEAGSRSSAAVGGSPASITTPTSSADASSPGVGLSGASKGVKSGATNISTNSSHSSVVQTISGSQSLSSPKSSLSSKPKAPKFVRRFRSRSLPIINYSSSRAAILHHNPHHYHHNHHNHHHHHHHHQALVKGSNVPPLPPINLQSLKEIDLHEILKNPQLRHDILFDPQLQFRPNLDGEKGRKKKSIIDKYWLEIQKECQQFFVPNNNIKFSRLPILFTTLRDILLSLLPHKDRSSVSEVMDIDLLIQQLSHGSFDFVSLARWLGEVFKSHCAPMRDNWVSEMIHKFDQAFQTNSVEYLVQGLRMIFSILEAMKLDVANHQIRILRPVLIETGVDFEKDYFNQLISHCKIDITDSLKWYYKNYHKKRELMNEYLNDKNKFDDKYLRIVIISSIIDLLSCRNMSTEFPSSLAFDHTRLVLLRADVRQLVCVQLCVVLYKQLLLSTNNKDPQLLRPENITKIQDEILAIVTDDNGNIKWTRNVHSIALQLVKKVVNSDDLPKSLIEFSHNWLIKQIQPISEVYGLMEDRAFKDLLNQIVINMDKGANDTNTKSSNNATEMSNISSRILLLVKFHWSVFGSYYTDYLKTNDDN
ncbi:uncharacterized protein PRCAT00000858001 [Priceomyces carsonii]|uniref:uncharacterized protein n=1 Tax=Priceomyces carsonii TaxID=28549 RepID=UPI002EDA7C87|nr:unnamed protein product [Priceomyces carsonii]